MERHEPTSLQEAIVYFADPDNCREYVVERRWPNGVECPTCGCKDVIFLAKQNRWQCRNKHSQRQFSLKTGTIYEDSPLGLDKWLTATWMVANCKNGVSSCEIARALNITQKTAWFLDHRVRVSLGMETPDKFSGHCEADETFIGQKARNMHKDIRARKITAQAAKTKRWSWEFSNAAKTGSRAGCVPPSWRTAERRRYRLRFASTFRPGPHYTRTP